MAICFLGLNAHAEVDYVAIGKIINLGKAQIADTRAGVVCLLKKYEADQSCANLENVNDQFKEILVRRYTSIWLDDCEDSVVKNITAMSPYYIGGESLSKAKNLAADAKPADAIWAVIEKYERSINELQVELDETYSRVKFNEIYVSKCMFGLEPSPITIKSLICQ